MKNGNFAEAADSLCKRTETIATRRAGPFRIIQEDCFVDDCIDNANRDSILGPFYT